jgi:hypothetical protein
MADIGQGKSCHVSIDDDKIMYGVFTEQFVLAGYAVAATTSKNVYRVRKTLLIRNMAAIDTANPNANFLYWGGTNVTPETGIHIAPGESAIFDFTAKKWLDIYITGAAGVLIGIAEFV